LISTYSNFSLPLVNLTLSSTEYLPTTNLPPGTLIYWRVRANGTHPSLWSASSFTTPNPPKNPALSSPANNGLINTYIPTLKWNASVVPTGAPALAYYHIQVDNDADFSSPLYDQSTLLDRVFVIPNPLADNQKYYWRVRAVNTEGHYAAWSTRSFNTRIFAPILEEPAPPPATTESLRPTLRWSTAPYAVSYTLVVSSFADFSSPLVSVTIPDTSYVPAVNLPAASLIYWRVMANGKNPSLWTSSSFNTPNPPARPILSTPGNTVLISGYTPKLKWNPALVPVGAPPLAYYHVQVDDHEDFSSPLYDQSVSFATEFTIVDPLSENMKYYWRVRAVNSEEQFSWWSVRSFRTRIYPLTIETPEAGTVSESLRPTFRWSSSPHATGYALVVSTLPDFSSPLINITVTENSLLPAINLPSATAIYWRVMAKGSNPSVWTTASFTTPNPPLLPALQSPTGNIITYTIQPTLTWKPVTAPADAPAFASYHLQLDNDPDYSSPMYDVTGLTSTNFSIPDSLPADQRYFWRVRALNTEGQFHWWSSSSFRTVVPSPEFIAPDPEAVLSIQKPQFNWSDVAGATSYTIAVSLYADLSSPLINAKVTDSQYISTISLPKGKVIYWRVRAHGTMGSSQWTAIRTFKIQ
jgi:hypothetical protein